MVNYGINKKLRKIRTYKPKKRFNRQKRSKSSCLTIRRTLLFRQKNICPGLTYLDKTHISCGHKPSECDHVIELRYGGDDSIGNLLMLCRQCHLIKTAANRIEQTIF
jgi:5-methylcytosine-specific restriction endonuclease McrA